MLPIVVNYQLKYGFPSLAAVFIFRVCCSPFFLLKALAIFPSSTKMNLNVDDAKFFAERTKKLRAFSHFAYVSRDGLQLAYFALESQYLPIKLF